MSVIQNKNFSLIFRQNSRDKRWFSFKLAARYDFDGWRRLMSDIVAVAASQISLELNLRFSYILP